MRSIFLRNPPPETGHKKGQTGQKPAEKSGNPSNVLLDLAASSEQSARELLKRREKKKEIQAKENEVKIVFLSQRVIPNFQSIFGSAQFHRILINLLVLN